MVVFRMAHQNFLSVLDTVSWTTKLKSNHLNGLSFNFQLPCLWLMWRCPEEISNSGILMTQPLCHIFICQYRWLPQLWGSGDLGFLPIPTLATDKLLPNRTNKICLWVLYRHRATSRATFFVWIFGTHVAIHVGRACRRLITLSCYHTCDLIDSVHAQHGP